jgi:uncharacterized protein (TIGR02145 family)
MIENSTLGTSSAQYYATYEDRAIGYYYTWDQAQAGDVCPTGFSLPNADQWARLRDFINSSSANIDEKADWFGAAKLAGNYNGANWTSWGSIGRWWGSPAIGTYYTATESTSTMTGPNSNTSIWASVRCIKD